jgi:16S rRNA (guanine1207-N2)-methyltransferase
MRFIVEPRGVPGIAVTLAFSMQRGTRVSGVGESQALGEALFAPIDDGAVVVDASQRVLVLGARDADAWRHRAGAGWRGEQTFKPWAQALGRAGLDVTETVDADDFDAALVFAPRSRERTRALYARAARRVRDGGVIVAAQANDQGARSAQADAQALLGPLQHVSRRKCRAFWRVVDRSSLDKALLAEWNALDDLRTILDGRYWSRPGLFAWDRVDAASALLAEHLPATLAGRVADLGAGYGYLATEVLNRCKGVTAIDLFEAEALAREPARRNLDAAIATRGDAVASEFFWHDVTQGLPRRYDAIVSNPPFHEGRADQPELGRAFIEAAADALDAHGELWLVANRHLPYEATLARRFGVVRSIAESGGFKVLAAAQVRA